MTENVEVSPVAEGEGMQPTEVPDDSDCYKIHRNRKTMDIFSLDGVHKMAPAYKLTYFNVTALGEVTRWLFSYAEIEFEDVRIEREAWPEHKPEMPFGQMPILTHDGNVYHQSLAIARFAAKQAKLVGKDDFEDMEIDGAVDTVNDLRLKIGLYGYEQDEARKEKLKEPLVNETIPYYLERLEKMAADNDGHLACNKLTWADFYFVSLLDYVKYMLDGQDLIEKHENLQKLRETVTSIPQIKKWIEERPQGWC